MAVQDYYDLFQKYGTQYGIDPKLLMAVAQQESTGNPNAVGPPTKSGTARGLMGILDSTAQANGVDPTNPDQAIQYTAKQLAQNLQNTGDIPTALKAYYGGPNQKQWGAKTAQYPVDVLNKYAKLGGTTATAPVPDYSAQVFGGAAPAQAAAPAANVPDYSAQVFGPSTPSATKPNHAGWRANGTGVEWYDPSQKGTLANTAVDVARSIPGGLAQGAAAVAGLPGDIQSLMHQGATGLENAISPGLGTRMDAKARALQVGPYNPITAPTSSGINALLSTPTGGYYQPQTTPGQYAQTIASFAPAMAAGGEGLGARLLKNAVIPGATSETAGQLTQGTPYEGAARFAGALTPTAAAGGIARLMGTGTINPARAALASKAINQFDIPLRGSQISQTPFANYLDSVVGKVPFSGLEPENELQRTNFSRAVAGTFGENATNLTPEVMSRARKRIGDVFDNVAAKTNIPSDTVNALGDKLFGILDDARTTLGTPNASPIENQIDRVMSVVGKDGTISGDSYQALTRKGAPLDRGMNAGVDPNVKNYVGSIRNALDDALEQSAAPEDLAALRTARLQWKNMRTVQDLASKAGIEGEITPALLLGAVRKSYKDMAYSGAGDIGDLANIGNEFLKEKPTSSTAERSLLYKLLELGGAGTAGVLGLENPEALVRGAAAAAGTVVASRGVGSALRSNLYRNSLLRAAQAPTPSNAAPLGALALHNLLNPNVNYSNSGR